MKKRIIAKIVILITLALPVSGYLLGFKSGVPSADSSSGFSIDGEQLNVANVDNGSLGVRNFMELPQAMEAVTGASMGVAPLSNNNYVKSVPAVLSADGDPLSISSSTLIAQMGMAAAFCQAMIKNEVAKAPAQRTVFTMIDFSSTAKTTQLTPTVVDQIADSLTQAFLGRSANAGEHAAIATAISESEAVDTTDANALQRVLRVPCAAVLGSTDFLRI